MGWVMIGSRTTIHEKWANWIPAKTAACWWSGAFKGFAILTLDPKCMRKLRELPLTQRKRATYSRAGFFCALKFFACFFSATQKKTSRALDNTPNATCTHLHSADADGAQKCTSVNTNVNATVYGIRNPTLIIPRLRRRRKKNETVA